MALAEMINSIFLYDAFPITKILIYIDYYILAEFKDPSNLYISISKHIHFFYLNNLFIIFDYLN